MEQGDFIDTGMGKGISSPKELILAHLNRMSLNIFSKAPLPVISEGRTGVDRASDTREIFISAVNFLIGISCPYYDEIMKDKQKEFDEQMKLEDKGLVLSSVRNEAWRIAISVNSDGKQVYENPQQAYAYWNQFLMKERVVLIDKTAKSYEVYISGKYELYFNLFKELNFLLHRKKWLVIEDYSEDDKETEE